MLQCTQILLHPVGEAIGSFLSAEDGIILIPTEASSTGSLYVTEQFAKIHSWKKEVALPQASSTILISAGVSLLDFMATDNPVRTLKGMTQSNRDLVRPRSHLRK